MDLTVCRADSLGLYLRFGSDRIVSFAPQTWGGIYYTATSVSEVDHVTHGRTPVAFDVPAGSKVPWTTLASLLDTSVGVLIRTIEPELVRLGWPL